MTEPICISFTPSREYTDAIRQQYNIRDGKAWGATPGDTWHLGLRGYDVIDPFIKSREPEERQPITCPGWRAIVDKARRFKDQNDEMWRIRDMAAALQPSVVKAFLKALNNGKS
jgi:hypothetical protein